MTVLHSSTRRSSAASPLFFAQPWSRFFPSPLPSRFTRCLLSTCFFLLFHFVSLSFSSCIPSSRARLWKPYKSHAAESYAAFGFTARTNSRQSYSPGHVPMVLAPSSWSEKHSTPKALLFWWHGRSDTLVSVPSFPVFSTTPCTERPVDSDLEATTLTTRIEDTTAGGRRQSGIATEKATLVVSDNRSQSSAPLPSRAHRRSQVASLRVSGPDFLEFYTTSSCKRETFRSPCCGCRPSARSVRVPWLNQPGYLWSIRARSLPHDLDTGVGLRGRTRPLVFIVSKCTFQRCSRHRFCCLQRASCLPQKGVHKLDKQAGSGLMLGTPSDHSSERIRRHADWIRDKIGRIDATEDRCGSCGTHSRVSSLPVYPSGPSEDGESAGESTEEDAQEGPFYLSRQFNHSTWERWIYTWWEKHLRLFEPDTAARHVAGEDTLFFGRRLPLSDRERRERVPKKRCLPREENTSHAASEANKGQSMKYSLHGGENVSSTGMRGEIWRDSDEHRLSLSGGSSSGLRSSESRQDKDKLRAFDPVKEAPSFRLLMPPPNVTGALHLGHAASLSIQDLIVRFRRMLMVARGRYFQSTKGRTVKRARYDTEEVEDGTGNTRWNEKVAWTVPGERYDDKEEVKHQARNCYGPCKVEQRRESKKASAAPLLRKGREIGSELAQRSLPESHCCRDSDEQGEEQQYTETDERDTSPDNEGFFDSSAPRPRRRFKRDSVEACRTEWIPGFDHAGLGMEWLFQKHALRVQERKKRRMQELLQERLCRQSSFSREKDKSGMDFSMKDVPLDLCDSATSSACESDCPPHMRRRPVSAGAQKGGSAQVEARDEQVKGTTARSDEETKRASVVQRWVSLCQRVIATQQRRLGCSCNWTRSVYTLDKAYRSLVENAFIELYRRGFIRRGSYLTLWDTGARTALADFEVIYPPPETLRLVACRRINTKKQVTKEAVRGKGGVYFSEGGELYADARAPNFMKRRIESVNNVQKATSSSLLHGAESSSEQINKDKQTLYFLSCELVRGSPSSTQPWPALCGQILSSEREARAQKEAEAEIAEEATTLPFSGPAHLFSEFEAHGTRGSAKISAGENCEEIRRGEEGRQGVVAAGRQESWMGKDNEGHRKERFRVAFALNDLRQLFGIAAICLKPRAFDRLTSAAAFISSSPRTSSSYLSSGTPALSCPMPASLGSPFRSPFSCGVSPEDSWFVLLPLVNRLVPVLVHEGEHLHPLAAATAVHLQKLQQAQAFTENELPSVCLLPSPDSSPVALLPNPGTLEGDSPLPGPLADGQSQTDGTVRGTYSRLRTGNVAAVGFAAFQEKGDEISWFSSSKEFEECEFDLVKRQSPAPETLSNLNKNGALDPPVEKTSASLPQRTKKMGEDGDGLISTRGTGNGETSVNEWLWSRVQEHGAAIGRVHMDGEDSAVLHPSCARYCGKSRKGAKELEGGYKEGEEESSCGLGKEEWTTVGVSEKTAKETDATLTWPRWISHRTGAEVQVRVSRQWLLDLPALSAKALEASLGERNKSFLNAKGEDKPQHSDTWVQQTPGQNAFPGPECQNAKKGTASIKGERPSSSVGQKGERRTGHSSFFTQEVLDSQRSKKVRMSFITEDCREHQKSRHEEKGDSVLFSKDQDALMLSGLRLLPDRYERQWMKALRPSNLRPWCVSRQLWWGQRLPVWEVKVAGGMKFLRDFTRRILTKETSTYHTKEEQAGGSPFSKTKSSSGTLIATDEKRERAGNEERESSFSHTGAGEDFKQGPYGTDVVGTGAFSRRGCLHPSTEIPGLKLRLLNAGDFDRSETPGESNEGEEQDEEWIEVAVTQEEALKAAKERLVKAWRSVGVQDPEAALDLLLRHSSPKHRDIEDNSDRGVDTLSQTKSNRQKGEEGAESDGIWHLGDEGDESREGKDQGKEGRRKEVSRPCGRRWRDGSSGAVGLEEEPRIAAEHELFKLERTKEVLDTWFSSALWATACAARASASSSASEEETRERTPPGRTEGLTGANTLLEMEPGQRQLSKTKGNAESGLLNRLIEQYGADALRYIAAFCGINPEALRQDVKEKWGNQENTREETPDSESLVLDEDSPHSDHLFEIKEEEKFGSPALEKREPLIVRYILSRMKEVAYTVTRLLFDKSDVGGAARLLQAFLWHDVADWLLPAATAMKKKKACILHELSPQRQSRNGTVADDQQDTNEAAETQRDHEEDPVRSQNHVRCNQAEMNQLSKSEDSAYLSSVERKKRSTIVTKEREGRGEQGRRSFLDISSRLEECSNCVHHWALVLLRVFDLSLRLLHPFLPFVSEALFQLVVLPWIARPHEKTVKAPSYSCASSNAMDRKEPVGIPSSQDKKKKTEDDAAEVTRKWTEIQGGEKYDSAAHQKLSQSLKAQEEGKKEKEEEDLNSGRQGSWQIENMTSRQGRADSEQDGSLVDTPSRREELGNEREKMKRRRRPPFSLLEDTEERIRRILFGNIHSESPRALMASRWPLHATEIPSTDAYALKAFKIFQNVVRRIRGAIKKFSQNASLVSSSDALRGRNRLSYVSRSTAEEEERKGGTSEKKKETDENSREGERKKDCLYVILRTSNRKLFNLLEEEKFFVANLSGVDPDNLRLEFDSPLQHSFPRENMDFVLNTDKKKQRESLSIEPEVTTEDKEETMQKEKRIEETDMKQDEEDDDTFPDLDIHVSSSAKGYPFLPSTEGEEIDSEGKKPDGEVPSRSQNGRHGAAELLTDKKDEEKEKEEEGMELLYSADDDSVKTKEAQSQSSLKQKTRRLRKAENVKQKIESLQERLTAPLFALRAPVDVQAKLKSRLKRLRREYEELLIDHDDG
ncbi:valine--trna ligase [Cystoisospora suis]|uniref:valine--tRNA ligase n=1 Tax=Cystoisospora suis TaxID=483139 RepID=A0A2C6L2Y1_9APIC|nr:valine--trna ligase [Cystoisospora suis]